MTLMYFFNNLSTSLIRPVLGVTIELSASHTAPKSQDKDSC